MKKVVLGLASFSLIVFLGACSSEPKSMEYFKDSILKDKTSKEYIECENAFKADIGKSMGNEPLDSKELLDEGREKANALFD